jgi:hypothetical protein
MRPLAATFGPDRAPAGLAWASLTIDEVHQC